MMFRRKSQISTSMTPPPVEPKIGTFRICTSTEYPFKFIVEKYYNKNKCHPSWHPEQRCVIVHIGGEHLYKTRVFDSETEAEEYITDQLKIRANKERRERELLRFIKDHPPREYP